MSTKTAHVGLWATRDDFNGELTVHLGSGSNWDESAPVAQLPESEEYYLTQLREFVDDRVDGESLFNDLSKYEPTLIGEFTINGEGDVLSHTMKV
jgi:hypothetical protein